MVSHDILTRFLAKRTCIINLLSIAIIKMQQKNIFLIIKRIHVQMLIGLNLGIDTVLRVQSIKLLSRINWQPWLYVGEASLFFIRRHLPIIIYNLIILVLRTGCYTVARSPFECPSEPVLLERTEYRPNPPQDSSGGQFSVTLRICRLRD